MNRRFPFLFSCAFFAGSVFAANGINPKQLKYADWADSPPKAIVVLSGYEPLGRNQAIAKGLRWVDPVASYQNAEPQQTTLCDLWFPDKRQKCDDEARYAPEIRENYLGPAIGLSAPTTFAKDDLAKLPPGVTKVLLLQVKIGDVRDHHILAAGYGEISDADLRQVALEQGVYRVMRYVEEPLK